MTAVGLTVVFGFLQFALLRGLGVNYEEISDTAANVRSAITVRVGITALVVCALAWWLSKAWGRSIYDQRDFQLRKVWWIQWMWVLPVTMIAASLQRITVNDWDARGIGYIAYLAIGCIFVGIAEEVMFRGIAVRAIRGSTDKEWIVMLLSSALFGLVHGINFLNGQALGKTISQVALAFAVGTTFYVILRLTGSLLLPIIVHAVWDFSTLSLVDDVTGHESATALALVVINLGTVVAYFFVFRKSARTQAPG